MKQIWVVTHKWADTFGSEYTEVVAAFTDIEAARAYVKQHDHEHYGYLNYEGPVEVDPVE